MLFKFLHSDCTSFFEKLIETELSILGDSEKHSFIASLEGKKIFSLRLPLFYPTVIENEKLWQYLDRVTIDAPKVNWTILLMEAGRAAVGISQDGRVIKHKNIRKYMVRKKNGKAQLTHLKSKGKSRYGSRLRLREAEAFFDEIIERLQSDEHQASPFIFYNCPVRLKSCLDEAGRELSFNTQDFTWRRLGVNVKEASFDELKRHAIEPYYCRFTLENETFKDKLPAIPEYRKLNWALTFLTTRIP